MRVVYSAPILDSSEFGWRKAKVPVSAPVSALVMLGRQTRSVLAQHACLDCTLMSSSQASIYVEELKSLHFIPPKKDLCARTTRTEDYLGDKSLT